MHPGLGWGDGEKDEGKMVKAQRGWWWWGTAGEKKKVSVE